MRPGAAEQGFSLLEVLVATTVFTVAVAGLAEICVIASRANSTARAITAASMLAASKMEQLRALTWGFDEFAAPLGDFTTDLTVSPEMPNVGVGLSPSPPAALARNTAGYCDFLDAAGHWLSGGAVPPAGAVFVRRWSIEPLPSRPADTLVLQVMVTRAVHGAAAPQPLPDDARLITLKGRKEW
jgi:prepilin-type N-terminal cleavage/methylation domain-containing protein